MSKIVKLAVLILLLTSVLEDCYAFKRVIRTRNTRRPNSKKQKKNDSSATGRDNERLRRDVTKSYINQRISKVKYTEQISCYLLF